MLLPTQEQVTILARESSRLPVPAALPSFESVLRVQDKVAQLDVLESLGLPHPASTVVESVAGWNRFPVFVKAPIGTASQGVRLVRDRASLRDAFRDFGGGRVVLQEPLDGPLVMVQAIFDSGRLVAWHANRREREGAGGGSSSKLSVVHPEIPRDLARLGRGARLARGAVAGRDPHARRPELHRREPAPGGAGERLAGRGGPGGCADAGVAGGVGAGRAAAAPRSAHAPAAAGGTRSGAARRRPPRGRAGTDAGRGRAVARTPGAQRS